MNYQVPNITPDYSEKVKITSMGNITEILYMSFQNTTCRIRKVDKEHYILLDEKGEPVDGEVHEFKHGENRLDNIRALRQTFRRLRNTINANVIDVSKVRFITLTYAQPDGEPMTDTKRLMADFEHYNKKFKRYCEKSGYGKPEYINVVEPQGSGSWHCHVLYFFDKKAPYIENEKVRELWGQGFVTVRALKNKRGRAVDNVGAYLTAYLGDLEVSAAIKERMDITKFECKEADTEIDGKTVRKVYLKGARLVLYPLGINIMRCSRGINRPVEEMADFETAIKKVSGDTLTFQKTVCIKSGDCVNTVSKRYYNSCVPKSQAVLCGYRYDIRSGEVIDVEQKETCNVEYALDYAPVHFDEISEEEFQSLDIPW